METEEGQTLIMDKESSLVLLREIEITREEKLEQTKQIDQIETEQQMLMIMPKLWLEE